MIGFLSSDNESYKVLSICKLCGHIEIEKRTIFERVKKTTKSLFIIIVGVLAVFGTMGIYNFIAYSVSGDINLMFQPAGGMWGIINTFRSNILSKNEKELLKDYSRDLIKDCEDDECRANEIYKNMESFLYEEGDDIIPANILREQTGDCDEVTLTMIYLLSAIDIDSGMKCSHNHCWGIVMLDNKKILADPIRHIWKEI